MKSTPLLIQRKNQCGRRAGATRKASGYTGDTRGTYIQNIIVDIHPHDFSRVTLEWAHEEKSAKPLRKRLTASPGAGNCNVDCSDRASSQRNGSLCTPIGDHFIVEGHKCQLNDDARAKFVTYFQRSRGVAFHYHRIPSLSSPSGRSVGFPASHGCVRLAEDEHGAEWIYDNSLKDVTRVVVRRDPGGGPGPKCWRGQKLIDRPPPRPAGVPAQPTRRRLHRWSVASLPRPAGVPAQPTGAPAQPASALAKPPAYIQPRLAIGPVDDPAEREAERVADQVLRMPAHTLQRSPIGIQRCAKCDKAKSVEELCPSCAAKARLQRAAASTAVPEVTPEIEASIGALRGGGQPLDAATREFMEPRFGHDFSAVRVHTDTRAARTAADVGALAFTVGSDIVFGAGQYQPGTEAGRRLIAHELMHVVQQS